MAESPPTPDFVSQLSELHAAYEAAGVPDPATGGTYFPGRPVAELAAFLLNHAGAILALVEATEDADSLLRAYKQVILDHVKDNWPGWEGDASSIISTLNAALEALNGRAGAVQ